jgi:hypothetical protein
LIKAKAKSAKQKNAKTLAITLRWHGSPVVGPVTVSEGGQPVATLQVPAKGVEYVYRSTKGRHTLQLAFDGVDGFAPTTANVTVRIK